LNISKIKLRRVLKTDLEYFRDWRNSPEIWKNNTQFTFLNMKDQKKWFKSLSEKDSKKEMFAIVNSKNTPVGICGLTNLDPVEKSGKVAIIIGEINVQSKGIGTQGLELLLEYGFKKKKLHRIEAEVLEFNKKSLSFFQKFNFKKEVRLRNYLFRDNKWWDMIVYSKIISD
tara:strand:+ start:546 stop:1058 length:513 start_codon:yes stop_codon:yes gene_type:complete